MSENPTNGNQPPQQQIHPKANGQAEAKPPIWTVLVYLAGDNNLTANCISVLQQLEAVKYNEDVCVLACFDSNTPWPRGSRYLAVNCPRNTINNDLDWEIHNDLIPPDERDHKFTPPNFCENPTAQSANPTTRTNVAEGLRRFLTWALEHHESERYMLVLYGHGPLVAGQTFLVRENPQSSLRFEDLRAVLGEHFNARKRLDILAFQNCVMNGVETAYEVQEMVDMTIGSQGLVLAAGWPYEKIFDALVKNSKKPPEIISRELLKACARHLIDFSLMDRSSEQSVCDIRQLYLDRNLTTVIRELVTELHCGLKFEEVDGEQKLRYPAICDALRIARLEAQSYWGETFVDLYDFCERLVKQCDEAYSTHNLVLKQLSIDGGDPKARERQSDLVKLLKKIAGCCIDVMEKTRSMVPYSYYIGSDLQYSHGLSIFFPWTMPGEPYFFVQSGNEYILNTAFETYSKYKFVKDTGWGNFLQDFFKATLRKVRRADREFSLRTASNNGDLGLVEQRIAPQSQVLTGDLQKSSSSTGYVDHEVWSYVKNYPRRNYLSPSDCRRKVNDAGCQKPREQEQFPDETQPPVSYLGWNIAGLVAEVITKQPATAPHYEPTTVPMETPPPDPVPAIITE